MKTARADDAVQQTLLAALERVDLVVVFEGDSPAALLAELRRRRDAAADGLARPVKVARSLRVLKRASRSAAHAM